MEQAGKVGAAAHSGNAQGNVTHACFPQAIAVTITLVLSVGTALVPTCADLFADFQFHDLLAEQADAFAEEIHVLVQAMLAQQLKECHTDFGHRVLLFCGLVFTKEHTMTFFVKVLNLHHVLRHYPNKLEKKTE